MRHTLIKTRILSSAIVVALVISCHDTATDAQSPSRTRVYLESEYVNFAWGYVHFGWFIDTAGNVISYDIAKSGTQWVRNPTGYYAEEELWTKIRHSDTVRGMIPPDTLEYLQALALGSVCGTYSDTICPGADIGAHVYSCYVFEPDSLKFRRVELRVTGDCSYHNISPSAIELANWLANR